MSAGINQSREAPERVCSIESCRSAPVLPHSDEQYVKPYLMAEAHWMQSTALDTSKNSKSMQGVTRMMDCNDAVQSFHCVLHSAAGGRARVGRIRSPANSFLTASKTISKLDSTLLNTMIMSQQLARGSRGARGSTPVTQNRESSTAWLSLRDDLGVRPECPLIMRVLFGDLLDCDRERASRRNAPWVFVWVLMVLTGADRC